MASIVIVAGCPGSGKTTLAGALARAATRGLHIPSDVFYGFPAVPVDPAHPDSHPQNETIMRALARSARAFADGGYEVVLDGIVGPWFLALFREELAGVEDVSYLILRVPAAEALRRVRARQGPGASAAVRHMVSALEELGELRSHALDTAHLSPDQVFDAAARGLREGCYRLERSDFAD